MADPAAGGRITPAEDQRDGPPPVVALDEVTKDFARGRPGFGQRKALLRAVDRVSLNVFAGQSLALVGESGSGKTTCARMALGLLRPSDGVIRVLGKDLQKLDRTEYRRYRRTVQAVFQDPFSSLNPRMSIGRSVAEPLVELGDGLSRAAVKDRAAQALDRVGLEPERMMNVYPHELSGGQRQRVAIARAIITNPACVILDEPVSALDVSIRAQVMNVLRDVQLETGLGYLMISHDLDAVKYLSTHIAVMYRGRIVELGTAENIYTKPQHPYSRRLLADAQLRRRDSHETSGHPRPSHPPEQVAASREAGCAYYERCPFGIDRCVTERPALVPRGTDRPVACHLVDDLA